MSSRVIGHAALMRLRQYRFPKAETADTWSSLGETSVMWCPELAIGCVEPMPNAAELADFYARDYRRVMGKSRQFEEHRSSPSRLVRARSQAAWVKPFAAETGSWLDVGAGYGLLLDQVGQVLSGWLRSAVEPDNDARSALARVCNAQYDSSLLWASNDGLPEKFDVISLSHVLEHLIDPLHALERLHEQLNPGGLLLLEVPNDHLVELVRTQRSNDLPHIWFFSLDGLTRLAARAGFQVLRGAELGLRRPGVYAPIATRVRRYVQRRMHGDKVLLRDPDWYRQETDRTDIRLLCWKPDRSAGRQVTSIRDGQKGVADNLAKL